jgi:hypothetical protein
MGNTGLYLPQNCPDHPNMRINGSGLPKDNCTFLESHEYRNKFQSKHAYS